MSFHPLGSLGSDPGPLRWMETARCRSCFRAPLSGVFQMWTRWGGDLVGQAARASPLKNDGVRQLGWVASQYMGKIKNGNQTTHQGLYITRIPPTDSLIMFDPQNHLCSDHGLASNSWGTEGLPFLGSNCGQTLITLGMQNETVANQISVEFDGVYHASQLLCGPITTKHSTSTSLVAQRSCTLNTFWLAEVLSVAVFLLVNHKQVRYSH